jgi:hypothetical protein
MAGAAPPDAAALDASSTLIMGSAAPLPQVKMMMESPVNPYVHMGNDLAGKDYADGVKYFTNIFPDKAKLHIMGAADDQVVGTLEVRGLSLCSCQTWHLAGLAPAC